MTNEPPFAPAATKTLRGQMISLALVAGVVFAALLATVTAQLVASKTPPVFWSAASIGIVFGFACVFGALLWAHERHGRGGA